MFSARFGGVFMDIVTRNINQKNTKLLENLITQLNDKYTMDVNEYLKINSIFAYIFEKCSIIKYYFESNQENYKSIVCLLGDLTILSSEGEIYVNDFEGYEMFSKNNPGLTHHYSF